MVRGTWVQWANGYFTLYSGLSYITVRMMAWLAHPSLLGHRPVSKSIAPEKVGDTMANPLRVYATLRAWQLFRMRSVPDFLEGRSCKNPPYPLEPQTPPHTQKKRR